tara:strand:- start:1930 stop:2688 length:759 start_codon:yes stop_codon:yes gene_type:complete
MILYKCLIGNFPIIPEEHYFDPNIEYVFFHTHPIENKHGKWNFINIPISDNPIQDQRKYKILSHELFNSPSIYVDFNYLLKPDSFNTIKSLLGKNSFNVAEHPFRKTYLDELCDWMFCCSDDKETTTITRYLRYLGYDFNQHFCPLGGFLIRDTSNKTKQINNYWWNIWNKFKKRDQLFLPPSVFFTKHNINLFNFDDLFDFCGQQNNNNLYLPKFFQHKNNSASIPSLVNKINYITNRKDIFNTGIIKHRI